jgi:hypothetical protein
MKTRQAALLAHSSSKEDGDDEDILHYYPLVKTQCHTRALRNKARCISYMRQEDNIYNNRVYRDKCHNNQSI